MAQATMNVQSPSGKSRGCISSSASGAAVSLTRGSTQHHTNTCFQNAATSMASCALNAAAFLSSADNISGNLSHSANSSGPGRRAFIVIPEGSVSSTAASARPRCLHSLAVVVTLPPEAWLPYRVNFRPKLVDALQ
jgi:hypothetical protein